MSSKKNIVLIAGPTGSGKTGLSIEIAKHFGSPILSCDSRQLYKGMAIGTAQPTKQQLDEVEHHLIDTYDIEEHYTAGRYEKEALDILSQLFKRHDVVVVVGGSGLYIDALCDGLDDLPHRDDKLRISLTNELETKGLGYLLAELQSLDPEYYEHVDHGNPKRIIRALEIIKLSGTPYSTLRKGAVKERPFNIIKIATELPRKELYERINQRVDQMLADGLEAEARLLYPHRELNSLQTVGYRELFSYFDGDITLEEAVELIKRNSRRYAKRQMTWFTRDDRYRWFSPFDSDKIISHLQGEIKAEFGD